MFVVDDFELPDFDLTNAEAAVAAKRDEEENQLPLDEGDGCEGGACKI